jgi:PLP dependent protein
MNIDEKKYFEILHHCNSNNCTLIAVSKTKPIEAIDTLFQIGHKDFGENYVQELLEKQAALPSDIRWHFIGHLQSNKAKYIIPFVHLIHSVDSEKLLAVINKEAAKKNIIVKCLLQIHIAKEETKFGLNSEELHQIMTHQTNYSNVQICGLMGMASNTDNALEIENEYAYIKQLYDNYKNDIFKILSIGMSGDYQLALKKGSNMIRVGSLIFGNRIYS